MNANPIRDYLVWDRDDRDHSRLVVARALRSIPVEALDAYCQRVEPWLLSLDPAYYDWLRDVLDADVGVADAVRRASRGGWGIQLRHRGTLPPPSDEAEHGHCADDHCTDWLASHADADEAAEAAART